MHCADIVLIEFLVKVTPLFSARCLLAEVDQYVFDKSVSNVSPQLITLLTCLRIVANYRSKTDTTRMERHAESTLQATSHVEDVGTLVESCMDL